MVANLRWALDPSGTKVRLTFSRPLLPRCNIPLILRNFSSASVISVANVSFQCPLLRLGEKEETRGSFESQRTRSPLILEDLKIDVKLFIGKGHAEIEE